MDKKLSDSLWDPTQPSLIQRAANAVDNTQGHDAWSELLHHYSDAIERCVRRRAGRLLDVDAIVRAFPGYVLSQRILEKYDFSKGRFRAFLQGVITNYVAGERRRLKPEWIAQGIDPAELELPVIAPDVLERHDERAWSQSLWDHAIERLLAGNPRDGEILLSYFGIAPFQEASTQELAGRLGILPNSVEVARHRAKNKLREFLEEELGNLIDVRESHEEMERERRALIYRFLANAPGDEGQAAGGA